MVCTVLEKWEIPKSKVSKVVTDNGSNMVAAFQHANNYSEYQEAAANDDDANTMQTMTMQTANGETDDTMAADWRLEASFDEDTDQNIEREISEFDAAENALNNTFQSIQRLGCFAHSVQCCVRRIDQSKFTSTAKKKAYQLIEKINKSPKATQLLIEKAKKKLLSACKTRWSYTYLALARLFDLRQSIGEITDTLQTIDNLTNSEWADVEKYIKLMGQFADVTYCIEGDKYSTLSEVIPLLLGLKNHLNQVSLSLPILYSIGRIFHTYDIA